MRSMKNVFRSMISVIVEQLQRIHMPYAPIGIHIIQDLQVVQLVIPLSEMEKQHLILQIVRLEEHMVVSQYTWMELKKHLLPVVEAIGYHLITMMALS